MGAEGTPARCKVQGQPWAWPRNTMFNEIVIQERVRENPGQCSGWHGERAKNWIPQITRMLTHEAQHAAAPTLSADQIPGPKCEVSLLSGVSGILGRCVSYRSVIGDSKDTAGSALRRRFRIPLAIEVLIHPSRCKLPARSSPKGQLRLLGTCLALTQSCSADDEIDKASGATARIGVPSLVHLFSPTGKKTQTVRLICVSGSKGSNLMQLEVAVT
jgi:hypothetical protein